MLEKKKKKHDAKEKMTAECVLLERCVASMYFDPKSDELIAP